MPSCAAEIVATIRSLGRAAPGWKGQHCMAPRAPSMIRWLWGYPLKAARDSLHDITWINLQAENAPKTSSELRHPWRRSAAVFRGCLPGAQTQRFNSISQDVESRRSRGSSVFQTQKLHLRCFRTAFRLQCWSAARPERLQLVADLFVEDLMLSHYETRLAAIFDRIEPPLAATLREKGRAGVPGRELLQHIRPCC